MSYGYNYMHSHSGLERTLTDKNIANKSHVLIDKEFGEKFTDCPSLIKLFKHNGKEYYKVPILTFVRKGGVFKNLLE